MYPYPHNNKGRYCVATKDPFQWANTRKGKVTHQPQLRPGLHRQYNIFRQERGSMSDKEKSIYDTNTTMQMLGGQYSVDIFWANKEVLKETRDIQASRPFEFTMDAAADIFILGFIHGKRAERARRKNAVRGNTDES